MEDGATKSIDVGTDPREWDDERLDALTFEELDRLVDIECAHRGIPLLPPDPGPKPAIDLAKKDAVVYGVEHGYLTVATYVDPTAAESVAEILNEWAHAAVETGGSGESEYVRPRLSQTVKTVRRPVYSLETWATIKDVTEEHDKVVDQWSDAKSEYDEALERRDEVASELRALRDDARRRIEQRDAAQAEFARYVDLADGVREIALVFMYAARPDMVRTLGLEDEALAARNPPEIEKHARVLRHRVGQVRRLVGIDGDGDEPEPADDDDGDDDA